MSMRDLFRKCKSLIAITGILWAASLLSPTLVSAENYGNHRYGQGLYGTGEIVDSTPGSAGTGDPLAFTCSDAAPGAKGPWLYAAIAKSSTSILLYFTAADAPVNKYILEYGTQSGSYSYGTQDMGVNSRDPMIFLVEKLSPNSTYYFRVRGGNGCAVGTWSGELSAKTKSSANSFFSPNELKITETELKPIPPAEKSSESEASEDQSADSESQTADSEGYLVKVTVKDTNQKPVQGAKVTLHSDPKDAVTDQDGIVKFENVAAGEHRVLIAYQQAQGEQSINLTGDVKEFELNITIQLKPFALSPLAYIIISGLGLAVIVLAVLLIKSRRVIRG